LAINRLQKVLEWANLKLAEMVVTVLAESGTGDAQKRWWRELKTQEGTPLPCSRTDADKQAQLALSRTEYVIHHPFLIKPSSASGFLDAHLKII